MKIGKMNVITNENIPESLAVIVSTGDIEFEQLSIEGDKITYRATMPVNIKAVYISKESDNGK